MNQIMTQACRSEKNGIFSRESNFNSLKNYRDNKLGRKNNYLKWLTLILCIVCLSGYSADLVKDGKTDYVVVVGTNGVYDSFAADEFQEIMKKSTGADFKCVKSGSQEAAKAKKRIFIGDSPELRKILDPSVINKLENLESLVTERGNDLVIIGGGNNGTPYGVYLFLEKELGYCYFNHLPGGERIPKHKNFTTSGKDLNRKIAFNFRRHAYMIYLNDSSEALFCYRNSGDAIRRFSTATKLKGQLVADNEDLDSGHGFCLYVTNARTMKNYKWDEDIDFFKTHPEYFSMNSNGKRTDRMQLCFSNPQLRQAFTKRVMERARRTGGKGFLVIAANDVPGCFCRCPECQKLEKKYDTISGPYFDYIIELCASVKKAYPELMIKTFAYRKKQSEVPPKGIKIPDNCILDFAPIDDDQGQALDGKRNLDTLKNLKDWSKIAKHITYWYYIWVDAPFGLVERLSRDMKLMYENGVRGVGVCSLGAPGMYMMQEYIMFRLMIDPYQDPWVLVENYNKHLYGEAAPEITQYVRELEEVWREPKKYIGLDCAGADIMNFTPERLIRWQKMFDSLEKKLAGKPYELKNLSLARWDIDMLSLTHYPEIIKKYPHCGIVPEQVFERMSKVELPRRWKVKKLKQKARVAYLVCKALSRPIPSPLNKLPAGQVIQVPQCGRIYSLKDPDAVCGEADSQPLAKDQMTKQNKKIKFDIYDEADKRFLQHGKIDVSKCTPGKYELYFVAKTTIPRGGLLALDQWWGIAASLAPYYPEGDEFREFEIWASLKFVGPSFGVKTEDNKDRMFCDRIFIVDRNAQK